MKHLPRGTKLPWHRVLRSNGELAFPVASATWKRQKALLENEQVLFRNYKVPLRQYRWEA